MDSDLAIAAPVGAAGRPSFSGKGEVFFGVSAAAGPSLVLLAGPAGAGGASPFSAVTGRAGLLDAEVAIGGAATRGAGLALEPAGGGVAVGVGLPLTCAAVLAVAPRAAAAANPPGAFRAAGGTYEFGFLTTPEYLISAFHYVIITEDTHFSSSSLFP